MMATRAGLLIPRCFAGILENHLLRHTVRTNFFMQFSLLHGLEWLHIDTIKFVVVIIAITND